ncbi:MAG TPA: O-antigen ligase family protein [Bryobacteraceae bacterium]|jgi:O-antigen ligase|nr:O-antigen ligase family protein [Bryobacteraceae bacterium]
MPATVDADAPVAKTTYMLLLVYLVIIFSRVLDVTVPNLKIPFVTLIVMCLALFLSGNVLRLLSSRTGLLLCAFTAWMGVTALTGVWWRGSVPAVASAVMSLALAFVIAGTLTTAERLKKALYVIGFCSLLAALESYMFGEEGTGRLALSAGSFMDPNAYAMTLVLGVPLLLFFARRIHSVFWKVVAIAGVIVILRTALYTGSRGALIAMGVLAVLLFFRLPWKQKILLLVISAVLLPAGYVLLPEYLKLRYLTLFTNDVQTSDNRLREQVEGGDMSSTESRLALLRASLRMTFGHPLFGVGPGDFPTENFNVVQRETGRKIWLVSHNSYTQASSETGIPGFLMFVTLLFLTLRNTQKVVSAAKSASPPPPLLVECALYLNITTLTICSAAFFLSIAYEQMIFVLVGLSVAVERLYLRHLSTAPVPSPGTAAAEPRPLSAFDQFRTSSSTPQVY